MMKLYHCPKTRSVRVLWLLEELEVPYQIETIDVFSEAGQNPDYLAINPGGSVPTLDDDNIIIYEASAICLYLSDKFPGKQLAPNINTPLRGFYYQWMLYVPATMELPLVNIFQHTVLLEESKRRPSLVANSKEHYKKIATNLNNALSNKDYILGGQFSTADIMIGSTLLWFPELMTSFNALQAYTDRLLDRPAFQKARTL